MIYAQKMDPDFRNDSEINICAGCLSVERKLRLLKDETKKMFHAFLDPLKDFNASTMLCWECMALINKIIKFRTQVRLAADSLSNYLLFKERMQPFTRLQSSDTECMDHETSQLTTEEVFTEARRQPAVKQEDSLEYFIELAANADDLKTEVTNSEHISDSVEQFSDSDDEPLSLKPRSNAGERPKKRKHKGEDKPHRKKRKEKRTGVVVNKKASRKLQQLNMGEGQVELVLLTWEELEEERQRALHNETFTRLEYKCYDCILGFNHRVKLENHMKKHEQCFGTEECDVCKIRCKDARALEAHTRRHRVRWRCSVCLSAWSRAAVAADHFARSHGSAAPTHRCSVCDHVASTLGKLRVHMKAHGERQRCDMCDKTFRDRSSLRTHLFIHKGEKEYSCPRCHKLFLFKKAMEVHLVTHLESAHLYCHECDKTFKNRMSYYGHMKYNLKHIDPAKLKYECELCDKKFAKAVRLEEHTAAIHLKVTPFSCAVPGCEFACSSRPVLRTHTRMVHRNARHVRNHVCHTCGKAYTTKKSLEGHMRAHTGERPFRCALCPSTFGYEAALYNHTRLVHRRVKKNQSKQMIAPGSSWEPTINTITLNIPGAGSGDS